MAKEFIKNCPSLCDKVNKAGHKPLTYWMLALFHNKDKEAVEEILNFIASKTNMEPWRNASKIMEANIKQLLEVNGRIYKNKRQALRAEIGYMKTRKKRRWDPKTEFKKTKFTDYRKKRRMWEKKYNQKIKKNDLISPIEVAVLYNRLDWLTLYLEKYNLIGNIVTNEGQHVFTYALSNCDSQIVQLLLKKGSLKQYIKNNDDEICYDLDVVFATLFNFTCKKIYNFCMPEKISQELKDAFLLDEKMEKGKLKDRLETLKSAHQIYWRNIREGSGKKWKDLPIPRLNQFIQPSADLIGGLTDFPECADMVVKLL